MNINEVYFKPKTFVIEGKSIVIHLDAEDCKICSDRNEEIEAGIYSVETKGHQIYLCKAHAQEFLDGIEDLEQKGDVVRQFIDEADES